MSRFRLPGILSMLLLAVQGFGVYLPDVESVPDIVADAIAASAQLPIKAVVSSNAETIRIFRAPEQETGKIQERRDYILNGATALTILDLPTGRFFVKDNDVTEMKWDGCADITPALSWKWAWNAIQRDLSAANRYDISVASDSSEPVWQVTVTTPTDNETLSQIFQMPPEEIAANRERFLKTFPAVKQMRIDPDNLFLYSCTMLNAEGKKLLETSWGDVEFSKEIAPGLFELPGPPDLTIHSREDFAAHLFRLIPASPPR